MESEEVIKIFLEEFDLFTERFSKKEMKTCKPPDYKVISDGNLLLYCEVKNAEKDKWIDEQLDKKKAGEIVGGFRNDPVFNRLTSHIHKATKQFNAVNPAEEYPNVLAFYNEDENSGFLDLLAVTTGNFFSDDGSIHLTYKNYSKGRIKKDIEKIHLFIWLDVKKPYRFLFNTINSRFLSELCIIFGYNPDTLKLVHS